MSESGLLGAMGTLVMLASACFWFYVGNRHGHKSGKQVGFEDCCRLWRQVECRRKGEGRPTSLREAEEREELTYRVMEELGRHLEREPSESLRAQFEKSKRDHWLAMQDLHELQAVPVPA